MHDLDNIKQLYINVEDDLSASKSEMSSKLSTPHKIEIKSATITSGPLSFEIFDKEIDTLNNVYVEYLNDVTQDLLTTLNIQSKIDCYLKNINPSIITIQREGKIISFIFLNYEPNITHSLKLHLAGISCSKSENFSDLFDSALLYIKAHFPFDEIIIDLYYEMLDDKFVINENIKNLFLKEKGFKWLNVQNKTVDGTTVRLIKASLKQSNVKETDRQFLFN